MNRLKKHIAISILSSIAIYLIASFIWWDITWISDISDWTSRKRGAAVFLYVCKEVLAHMITSAVFDLNNIKTT